jgi:hypothetical protein
MSITQSLNSKANVKKTTSNDLPFSPAQPVINSYYATSTSGQTIINFGFTLQAAANGAVPAFTDIFWLFVDGKKLDLGSSNDYTFTSIGSDGTSSQVTLNFSLISGLNIQAFKLGLKPEIQFTMDNRFTQLYANQNSAFQGFVSQTDAIITATTTVGSPVAGTFYSQITNRAPIVDISQDLKPRFGIERISAQAVQVIQTEFGSNGEPVFGIPNDTFNLVRLVGSGWVSQIDSDGPRPFSSNLNDYVEIVFYGTGLNMLSSVASGAKDIRVTVDGGTEGTTTIRPTIASGFSQRNYPYNLVCPAASGLALGIHTVKIRLNSGNIDFEGFEILNQVSTGSSLVTVNPGIAYSQGQKSVLSAQSTLAYNAAVVGTTGGRVVEYITLAGTRGQAFTQNATSPSYLTAASHTNEELARTYIPREFGAGRSDDFSLYTGNAQAAAFTLDDGVTTLVASSGVALGTVVGNYSVIDVRGFSGYFVTLTFVGTGLDIGYVPSLSGTNTSTIYQVYVDGVSQGYVPATASVSGVLTNLKVASGLPYGTHTVQILCNGSTTWDFCIYNYKVYQPKTPSIPSGCVQLGSYNIMANYSATTGTQSALTISAGVLRKSALREFTYTGSWSGGALVQTSAIDGWIVRSTTNGDSLQFTFFGTGVEIGGYGVSTATTSTIQIDGSAYTGTAVALNGTSGGGTAAWTPGTSTWTNDTGFGAKLQISGLTLGLHTLKLTTTATGSGLNITSADVITPLYSPKSNLYADFQNTLTVGSNSISDDRQTTPIKNALPATKASAMAVGITSNPTTSASYTAMVPMPDMSVIVKTSGGALDIQFYGDMNNNGSGNGSNVQIYVDAVPVGPANGDLNAPGNGYNFQVVRNWLLNVAPGFHTVQVYWGSYSGTLSNYNTSRVLIVKEK